LVEEEDPSEDEEDEDEARTIGLLERIFDLNKVDAVAVDGDDGVAVVEFVEEFVLLLLLSRNSMNESCDVLLSITSSLLVTLIVRMDLRGIQNTVPSNTSLDRNSSLALVRMSRPSTSCFCDPFTLSNQRHPTRYKLVVALMENKQTKDQHLLVNSTPTLTLTQLNPNSTQLNSTQLNPNSIQTQAQLK